MATPAVGIQGQTFEITLVGCNKLRDMEWISRQDPYVCLEYASTKLRSRTCTSGGKNPTFNEKFAIVLIEGLREINVAVWNSHTLRGDDFIGSGKIQLNKVLSQGYDDSTWFLQSERGKYAGEVRAIMHYTNTQNPVGCQACVPPFSYPPTSYPSPPHEYHLYPLMPTPYAPPSYPPAPPQASAYPHAAPYSPQHYIPTQSYYPPAPYPRTYPPSPY